MIDPAIATIVAACIGATASITGAIIAARAKSNPGAATSQAGPIQAPVQAERPALGAKSKLYAALLLAVVILLVAVSVFFVILEIIIATGMSSRIQGDPGIGLLFAFLFAFAAQYMYLKRKKIY
jgi:hypothetical protein